MKKFALFLFSSALLSTAFICGCRQNEPSQTTDSIAYNPVFHFGINCDSFVEKTFVLKKGELVNAMFEKCNVAKTDYLSYLEKSSDFFNTKRLRAGQPYSVFFPVKDSSKAAYLVYENNLYSYVKFDFLKSDVNFHFNKIDTVQRSLGAAIHSNLWFTLQDAGVDPLLSDEMSVLFSWTIDFFGIQNDDVFKIVYDEINVNDTTFAAFGKIHTAYFKNEGREIYAIPFLCTGDTVMRFFNIDGSSLKGAFLKAPLEFRRIASKFSNARMHPILRIVRPHYGVDYCAPAGTPVRAVGDGTVIHCQYSGGAGNFIKIRHTNGFMTGYMHLIGYARGIHNGKHVVQGDVIGYVGSTGLSTGPHLDFRVWRNNQPMNPLKLGDSSPKTDPVPKADMERFNIVKDSCLAILNNIEVLK